MNTTCGLCQKPATGLASINDTRYCHGDDDPSPTCYEVAVMRGSAAPGARAANDLLLRLRVNVRSMGGQLQTMPDPYRQDDTT